jgi:hypothetical protein
MANIFSKAAGAVGDVIGGFTDAITGGRGMKTSSSGQIEKLLADRKAAQSGTQPQVMKSGGKVSSASSRADGCAVKGKTRGKYL